MPGLAEFMVVKTGGFVAAVIRVLTKSPVNHAAIYVGHGFIVEAQPKGARVTQASNYDGRAIWSNQTMTIHERLSIIEAALNLVGTPYSYLDIAALAVEKGFGRRTPGFLAKRLGRPDRLICSQLVAQAYRTGGNDLFPGRHLGEITPGDLYDLIVKVKQSG